MADVIERRLNTMQEQLSKQDGKIDKLITATTEIIKFDTKLANHAEALARYGNRMDEHGKRLHEIEIKVPVYDDRLSTIKNKSEWIWKTVSGIIIAALVGLILVGG